MSKTIGPFDGKFAFLSNFYICWVEHEGIGYTSSEAAYQAAKTLDLKEREKFVMMEPAKAKRAGKKLKLRPDWETVKLDIMYEILKNKFSNDDDLRELLLGTGNAELVEVNYWNDTFYGVCNGVGQNHLGRLLMKIRSELST